MGNLISVTEKKWNILSDTIPSDSEELLNILAQNRNVKDIDAFVNTVIKNTMPDPFVFVDMELAVQKIVAAIKSNKKIVIFGDYDVDGVSSTAILINFFNYINVENTYVIPNRMTDGYGLSIDNIKLYKDYLIITVDCGSSALNELQYAVEHNVDIVVIDHHIMRCIPKDVIVVNPHRPDESDQYKYLCAAGMAFICVVGINRELKNDGFYTDIVAPNMMNYLDLVALATVCDVVNLTGLNRAFVSAGLKVIANQTNVGIKAMMKITKNNSVNTDTIAFGFGPRINAAGRIGSADISVKLLTTQNESDALAIAAQLDDLNKQRQQIELEILQEAETMINHDLNFICLYKNSWHIGVIGIVAGRLKEKYQKPTIIISQDMHGVGKASCRSINSINIASLIQVAVQKNIVAGGGGHAVAAGFSIDVNKIQELQQFLEQEVRYESLSSEIVIDCELDLDDISIDMLQKIEVLEPFGQGNKRPRFAINNLKICKAHVVADAHMQVIFENYLGTRLRAICFKCIDTPIEKAICKCKSNVSVCGVLSIHEWNSKKYVNMQLEDISCFDKVI